MSLPAAPPTRLRRLVLRAAMAPFEGAIARLVIVQAALGLVMVGPGDPLSSLIPRWQAVALYVAYLVSGLMILYGMLRPRGDVEGAGLVILIATVLGRGVLFGVLQGWELRAFTSLAYAMFIADAAVLRLYVLVVASRMPLPHLRRRP